MKIATWNVNSIRTRLDHVVNWLQESQIEVLCLQETKVVDEEFPRSAFTDLGYQVEIWGQKSYNGVAILSKAPLQQVSRGFAAVLAESADPATQELLQELDQQKRVITGVLDDVRIVNLYVPNGSEIGSEKYHYKLRWLGVLRDYLHTLRQQTPTALLVCGDFNIALEDRDIHDPKGREKRIMASDTERQALQTVLDIGLIDVFRQFTPEPGHFSWWDYRTYAFRQNRGWRIDHHYATPELAARALSCTIDIEPRKLEKPSDHTPVIIEF